MAVSVRGNPWRRVALTLSGMAVVLLLAASFRYLDSRGVFTSVKDVSPGVCRQLYGLREVRDIVPAPFGRVYIAAADGLYAYGNGVLARFGGTPKNFHPVALAVNDANLSALFRQEDAWKISGFLTKFSEIVSEWDKGVRSAEAVKAEKPGTVESIIVTKPIEPTVEELSRLSADTLTDPAGVAALPGDRFYLINRHGTHSAFGRWLDDTFLLPRANILYFDGMKFVTVAERLNSPSGIALSPDGAHLYVAQDYPGSIASFARNEFTGALEDPQLLSITPGLRKITVSSNGDLIVAARPKAGAGQVWRVRVDNGVPQKAELIYSKKGAEVTSAAELGRHLLIGTTEKLVDCGQ